MGDSYLSLSELEQKSVERKYRKGAATVNKNIIVLIVLAVVMFALVYFYAYPQWKKYHPSPAPAPAMPGGPGMMPGAPDGN